VAVIPFLWVLPLSLYLLTFILCFDHPRWYARKSFTLLLLAMLALLCDVLFKGSEVSLLRQVTVYCGSLFVGCMVCHGEVFRVRPSPGYLTSFYLLIAAGGAAGGVFVAVLAPLVFKSYAELNWGVWLLATLVLLIHTREKRRWLIARWRLPFWPALGIGVVALGVGLTRQARQAMEDTILRSRNFYGGLQVIELAKGTPYHAYKLQHGNTTHGLQFLDPFMATMPTTYYDEPSGVGLAMTCFPRQNERRIGVVGLGVGTMAAYPQAGDVIRFYEINPEVRRLAETRFTYLKDCKGRVEVVLGDARLSLETEPSQQFDLLVLDAFSSDAIPLHLLTREAFAIYLRHLKPDGVIAVHISNRYLNLVPVVRGAAAQFRLGTVVISGTEIPKPGWFKSSRWVLLSSNQDFLNAKPIFKAASASPMNSTNAVLWTDDHASLFRILR
jgi:spermidine synthase